jgi:low temperature requirement protein LtrA
VLRADARVSAVELFYDLVYVFAVTQLSHLVVAHPNLAGLTQAAVLLAMVWQVWVYTTWAVNYLDPARAEVRAMLLVLMLGSLLLAVALTDAFSSRGLLVAVLYVGMQVGRALFMVAALRGQVLQVAFVRILPWSCTTGLIVLLGTLVHGYARAGVWAAAVAIDLIAAEFGFVLPGLGRSATTEWTVSGAHFAERCQAFVLIALGESIVVIGATLAALEHPSAEEIVAFLVAFAGSVVLWWIYFARAAEDSSEVISSSRDPGRLARDAFHWVHPLIIGGIILAAAADNLVLAEPSTHGRMSTAWLVVGGAALFLIGHAAFKAVIWHVASWPRVIGAAVCLALLALAPHVSALVLAITVLVVILGVAVADQLHGTRGAAGRERRANPARGG